MRYNYSPSSTGKFTSSTNAPAFKHYGFLDYRINPHKVIEMTSEDEAEFQRRLGEGIGRFDAVSNREGGHCGYEREADYGQPRSRYQKWMRAKMGDNDSVTYHYTARFGALIVER